MQTNCDFVQFAWVVRCKRLESDVGINCWRSTVPRWTKSAMHFTGRLSIISTTVLVTLQFWRKHYVQSQGMARDFPSQIFLVSLHLKSQMVSGYSETDQVAVTVSTAVHCSRCADTRQASTTRLTASPSSKLGQRDSPASIACRKSRISIMSWS